MDAPLPPCLSLAALGTLSTITALVAPRPLRPCAAVGHSAFLLIPSWYLPALLPSPPPPVLATALWFLFPPGGVGSPSLSTVSPTLAASEAGGPPFCCPAVSYEVMCPPPSQLGAGYCSASVWCLTGYHFPPTPPPPTSSLPALCPRSLGPPRGPWPCLPFCGGYPPPPPCIRPSVSLVYHNSRGTPLRYQAQSP